MAFVVDGSEWIFNGWSADDIDSALGLLLERCDVARQRQEQVWIGDDLQTRSVLGCLSVWDLWSPECPITLPRELKDELAAMLGRTPLYLDQELWPEGMAECTIVSIFDSEPFDNPDVAWAHHKVRSGHAVACFGLQRSGLYRTATQYGAADVHWVIDEAGHRGFFRAAIDVEQDSEATLQQMAPHAFPDIIFLDGVWRGLDDFAGGYLAVRQQLRRHLTVFDDHGYWAFTEPPPKISENDDGPSGTGRPGNLLIQQRFQAHGVDVAPESSEVRAKQKYRITRERVLKGRTLFCEWHAKLQPHINRIHVHAPVPESGNRFIVAIFHAHLPLPGDN